MKNGKPEFFEIYSLGMVYASVCTTLKSREAIVDTMNEHSPTGIGSDWAVSEDPAFRTGEPNPCQCEEDPDRMHWLLNC